MNLIIVSELSSDPPSEGLFFRYITMMAKEELDYTPLIEAEKEAIDIYYKFLKKRGWADFVVDFVEPRWKIEGVRLDTEHGLVEVDRPGGGASLAADVDLRHRQPPFTASRMRTVAPRGPGTEPRTSSSSRSASACTTSRFSIVVLRFPIRPGMRLPLNTRDGVAHWPTAPGLRCTLWAPCEARWPENPWRFMAPAKPLPLLTEVTSTRACSARDSTVISWPTS